MALIHSLQLITRALLLHFVDHRSYCLFLFHRILYFSVVIYLGLMEVNLRLIIIYLLKSAVTVIRVRILLIPNFTILILCENFTGFLRGGVGLNQDLCVTESLEDDLAVSVGFDDGTELGQVELFILDDQPFGGEVDEYLAEGHFSMLFELGDVNKETAGDLILADYDELAADLFPTG